VPQAALYAILDVEGGRVGEAWLNTNGSYDMGPMQINSLWLRALARQGVSENDLINDGCRNVHAGAWILAREMQTRKGMAGVGAYHSKTPRHQKRYRAAIVRSLRKIKSNPGIIHRIVASANR